MRAHLEHCRPCFGHARFEESFLAHAGEPGPARGCPGTLRARIVERAPGRDGARLTAGRPAGRGARGRGGGAAVAWRLADASPAAAPSAAWMVGTAGAGGHGLGGRRGAGRLFRFQQPGRRPAAPASGPASTPRASAATPGRSRANGGPAALGALLGLRDPALGLWLVTGSLAAAAADTWATSLGGRSRAPPAAALARRTRGAAGTSGGMTLAGSLGAARPAPRSWPAPGAVAGGRRSSSASGPVGFAGMLADSALGALWQGRFHCPAATWRANGGSIAAGPATIGREGSHG